MTEVVFYHLKSPQQIGKLQLVCQLAGTAFRKGHKVYVSTEDAEQCAVLNKLMWTFAPNAFIPHASLMDLRDPDPDKYPVVIGFGEPPEKFSDVLISLKQEVPAYASRFKRVVEPVGSEPVDIEQAKTRFQHYESLFDTEPKTHFI